VLHVDALGTALRALDGTSRLARRLKVRAFVDDRRRPGGRDPVNPGGRPPRGRRSVLPPPPEFVDARAGRAVQRLTA